MFVKFNFPVSKINIKDLILNLQGSVNKFIGKHPLGDRARKIDQGVLIVRFVFSHKFLKHNSLDNLSNFQTKLRVYNNNRITYKTHKIRITF